MDDRHFDAVTRHVGSSRSRRQALSLLASGIVAAWLPRAASAAPLRQGGWCQPGLTYCEEQPNWAPAGCYDLATDYLHCGDCLHQCPSAGPVEMACAGGACVVVGCGDLTDCSGNLDCTDVSSDPNNCGACGVICPSGTCQAGRCFGGCDEGQAYCPSRIITIGFNDEPYELEAGCYDLFTDNTHCGSCDVTCPTTVGCYAGECTLPPS